MSQKSVILHEEITSSQEDTESVVGSAGTHFAVSINLHVPLKRKLLRRWARRVGVEFRNRLLLDIMAKLIKLRGGRQTSRLRQSILFVVLPRWRSTGSSTRVSLSHRFSQENDWRDKKCLMVLLTPLDLRNVSFHIFKTYLYPSYQNSLAGQSLNSIRLVLLRALKPEDDFVRLLCFSV